MSNKREVKIERGITDVTNVLRHLADAEKKARKEQWLRDNYSKINRRKSEDKND